MDLSLENLNINGVANEITEYIDRSNFYIDTRGTSDGTTIKGVFLTAVGKEAFTLLKTLAYPKILRNASSQKFKKYFCDTPGLSYSNWSNGRSFTH